MTKQSIQIRPKQSSYGLLRCARNDRSAQSGNAVILILIGICLFGALAFTFMQGAKSGQGNLTSQQAKIAAQELLDFFNSVERAVQKLRQKGCSENDISFASSKDTGNFIATNDSVTAPPDKSCHVFDSAGAGLNMNMDWKKYQISYEKIVAMNPTYAEWYDNLNFRVNNGVIINVGTSAPELSLLLNFTKPEICSAYNAILSQELDFNTADGGPIYGDDNPTITGKTNFCMGNNTAGIFQIRVVEIPR